MGGHIGLKIDESDVLGFVIYLVSRKVIQRERNLSVLESQLNIPLLEVSRSVVISIITHQSVERSLLEKLTVHPRLFVMAIVEPALIWSGLTRAKWLLVFSDEENFTFL